MTPLPELSRDPVLAQVWAEAGLGELLGIAAGSDGESGCAVAVTAAAVDPDPALLRAVADRMAAELGLAELRLLTVHGQSLRTVARDWLYQAAQGSGRGVSVRLDEQDGRLTVLVSSWDSSAREVELRLAGSGGAQAVEAAALAQALGYPQVVVRAVQE
jgi:hypothetical protein